MSKPVQKYSVPLNAGWEIAFTRIASQVAPRVKTCIEELTLLLETTGLTCKQSTHVTNQGVSALLSCSGTKGLLFSFDFRLLDGMIAIKHPGAVLEVNLHSADAETVAFCSPIQRLGPAGYTDTAQAVIATAGQSLSIIGLYEMVIGHFDLVFERPRAVRQR